MTSALSDKDREMIFFSYFGNFCLVLILFLTLPSCTSSSGLKQEDKGRFLRAGAAESGKQTKMSERNEKLFLGPSADRTTSSQDYRIGPEDLLEITVFEDEKLNKTVRVSSQGNIGFPLLGAVRVKGLTVSELEREIQGLLAEKYIQNPNVSVFIKEYRNQRISVLGMVEKPGIFDVTGQKTVLDMLALAGGLKEDAGPLLFLIHSSRAAEGQEKDKDSSRQGFETLVIHLDELLVRGDLSRNAIVSHRDMINIPASGKVFVGGAVVKPGGFPLKGKKLTVSQAIALAEGLKPESSGSEARIYRYSGRGDEKEAIPVDVLMIQDGLAEDPHLQEGDMLIVPTSPMKNFLIGFRDSLKGFFSLGLWFNP